MRKRNETGLYDPANEHDACGVGFVVNIDGDRSHVIVENGLKVLENLRHRGAEGADNKSGDGAGILTQIPHEFILLHGIPVPERGKYGTGLVFLPRKEEMQKECLELIRKRTEAEGLTLMYVRDVPVDSGVLGETARSAEPEIKQVFITGDSHDELERRLYLLRKKVEKEVLEKYGDPRACYFVSLSSKRIVYKGMLTSSQLRDYFTDLSDPYYTSAIALVHSRFSTNTFPTWDLAQPFRLVGHNGEINTIAGNRMWVGATEPLLSSRRLGNIQEIAPVIQPEMSDSASLDNVLEFFVMSGMSLPHALAMLVPESFNDKNPISHGLKGFYDYHSIFMEPWDGPAALFFSDGRYVGGMLDRNGLRPARYLITTGGMMVVASETGVLDIAPSEVKEKGRFRPGKMLIVDTESGTFSYDAEIKKTLAEAHPYTEWLEKERVTLDEVTSGRQVSHTVENYPQLLRAFGYSREDVERVILPMAANGSEPLGAMGYDVPLAVLSARPQRLFNYFRQRFAQVTNPPIDPIREELVMSLTGHIGAVGSDLLTPSAEHCRVVRLHNPLITNRELDILHHLEYKGFRTVSLSLLFRAADGVKGVEKRLEELCREAGKAVDDGCNYIIISDKGVSGTMAPIPSLLALSAIHHSLIRQHKRAQTALIVESAEPREVMHIALLIGFGASAVCPYMAFAVLNDLVEKGRVQLDYDTAEKHYIKAVDKGLLKIMSKSGISTIRSYRGAKMFESIGLAPELLDRYFAGMSSPVGGDGLERIVRDTVEAVKSGFGKEASETGELEYEGNYAYRQGGEQHAWTPRVVAALQKAVRTGDYAKYKEFSQAVDGKEQPLFLRDLLVLKKRKPVPLEEVESAGEIMKRFATGAMSFGSVSREAHEALAVAMNRIGGRSNTGEGGEAPERYAVRDDGTSACSAVKQVASGRFGVDPEYLVHAEEIQIKVAQGAKPGEGGQLPGYKVDELVARTRRSIPGITLISPPPHHDIYSIEDLSQLIFDLKNVNPEARISVKLVSGSGIGTIAAGVVKAKADMIVVSGADGGTGASPLGSIRYAGMPLETGLSEVQQTLMLNNLRGKVRLQADGQLKTGFDVVLSALLGAEEFGFATSALVALGCVMDRKCHTNACPVGIATQDEKLRCRFAGKPEHVVNYFTFLAEEVREHLAAMGFTRLDDVIGRTDLIGKRCGMEKRGEGLCFDRLLWQAEGEQVARKNTGEGCHPLPAGLKDAVLMKSVLPALDSKIPVCLSATVCNTDRSFGAMLSGEIARRYGREGLPDDTIRITLSGSAGQSFGAFLARGITLLLEGDANDYAGKGLAGGKIALRPARQSAFRPECNTIAGNTLLYGATGGEMYINGRVGERFCVRNSGAIAVVEGICDHGCEYMTGGRVVVLGPVGRNFAAGMSGGIAYVWNPERNFDFFCNMELVEITLPDEADLKELQALIAAHFRATESPLAARMLADWESDGYAGQFLKVMPIEYKRILDAEKTFR